MGILRVGLVLGVIGFGVAAYITQPQAKTSMDFSSLTPDAANGALVFAATGCASCHMAPDAAGDAQLVLSGGQKFPSQFGTFLAPNISTDPTHGIGGWSIGDFSDAVRQGVSPDGSHYFPAMPYGAYNKLTDQDLVDLKTYMDGLPASPEASLPHEVGFPFNIRRLVGGWKFLFLHNDWVIDGDLTPDQTRGRYIAEAMAHCGECHTPRNLLGGLKRSAWLSGAPNPSGVGEIPDITPKSLTWSEAEVVEYLTTGFTPEFDSVGGHMAHVVENMSKLPESDRAAVAAYLTLVSPAN